MRVVHLADLHLGMENYGRNDPATGLSTRLEDFLNAFDEVIDFALEHSVDLFLFCGDAYKNRDPSPTHQREFARRLARLIHADIPVFLLVGNHDLPNAVGRATSLEIFHTLALPNVHVGNQLGTHLIETKSGPIQIVAVPWILRSKFLSREDNKNLTLDEINRKIADSIDVLLQATAAELDQSLPTILAGHAMVADARVGSERLVTLGHQYTLLRSTLARPEIDYVALGHVHRYQVFGGSPPIVYSGSLQRVDFSEEDEPEKGFVVIDIQPVKPDESEYAGQRSSRPFEISFEFQPVHARRFLTIDVDTKTEDPTAEVLQAIERHDVADTIVRLRIRIADRREGLLDEAKIRKALKDAYFIAAVAREVIREQRTRISGNVEHLTPTEALKAYLGSRQTPSERQAVLLAHAQKLLEE